MVNITKHTENKIVQTRPPIVTVMGHVDHGKTTLLDYLKKTSVAEKEAGGITQRIGAYQVETKNQLITFIDTPGHEAFMKMRERGAKVTDIIILVVAADEGVKPQTKEVIRLAKESEVPLIVAINKIDRTGANPEKVMKELAQEGVVPEEWGGDNIFCNISAKNGEGVERLLEMTLLVAEMQELKTEPGQPTNGTVIESNLDSRKGIIATVIIKDGTLKINDWVVMGSSYGKIKKMEDYQGKSITEALPGTPALLFGLKRLPFPGDELEIATNEKEAEEKSKLNEKNFDKKQITGKPQAKLLRLVIKTDTQGSLEGINYILDSIPNKEEQIHILKEGVGLINESDIKTADLGNGLVVGFNVEPERGISELAKSRNIEIRGYNIIYKLKEDIESLLESKREPKVIQTTIGKLKVLKIFKREKDGIILGGQVIDGKMKKSALLRIIKNEEEIGKGKLSNLQFLKQDVHEVKQGSECGIYFKTIELHATPEENDIVEAYEEKIS